MESTHALLPKSDLRADLYTMLAILATDAHNIHALLETFCGNFLPTTEVCHRLSPPLGQLRHAFEKKLLMSSGNFSVQCLRKDMLEGVGKRRNSTYIFVKMYETKE
ncbi:hypothetical protein Fot_41100 [Forsythia ovata]|uniref:Uncharacterized protein n=1 Tax=Forsythia ovata TaxID=205694 RepID=A0ABD1RJ45_9LAMI